MDKIILRSDRDTDYTFTYQGEEQILPARGSLSVAGGLEDVVLPTCIMKVIRGVIVIKQDASAE